MGLIRTLASTTTGLLLVLLAPTPCHAQASTSPFQSQAQPVYPVTNTLVPAGLAIILPNHTLNTQLLDSTLQATGTQINTSDSRQYVFSSMAYPNITLSPYIVPAIPADLLYTTTFTALNASGDAVNQLLQNNGLSYIGTSSNTTTTVMSISEVFTTSTSQYSQLLSYTRANNMSITAIHNHYTLNTSPAVTFAHITGIGEQVAVASAVAGLLLAVSRMYLIALGGGPGPVILPPSTTAPAATTCPPVPSVCPCPLAPICSCPFEPAVTPHPTGMKSKAHRLHQLQTAVTEEETVQQQQWGVTAVSTDAPTSTSGSCPPVICNCPAIPMCNCSTTVPLAPGSGGVNVSASSGGHTNSPTAVKTHKLQQAHAAAHMHHSYKLNVFIEPQAPAAITMSNVNAINVVLGISTEGKWTNSNASYYTVAVPQPVQFLTSNGTYNNSLAIELGAEHGAQTTASFVGTASTGGGVFGQIAVADQTKLTPVLAALQQVNIVPSAIVTHYILTTPQLLFVHYSGTGNLIELATGVGLALNVIGANVTYGLSQATSPGVSSQGNYTTGYVRSNSTVPFTTINATLNN